MNTDLPNEFGLKPRDMNTIHGILDKYPEIILVNIFGSRAKGTFKFGSDVDLAIINPGVDKEILRKIIEDFEESNLPFRVDIISTASLIQSELNLQIKKFGIPFYNKDRSQKIQAIHSK
jgi:predicted nucleotidyltransferase